ncbi:hypothetical protein NHP21005_10410 [Helicobacter sp. NHP21005]|uniref:AAA family ATPase n=1 Tax=Helicobacter felistomachi TaxID=3040201 RepID=UPI00257305AC|nr:AAA family ATPase [Helicobacter sp. NHP21005]BEG57353.1 hypothetical protein NHP21005_10410 [Helicobacter sp. NHP21005]
MQEPKKSMSRYELEKYLLENGAGEVAELFLQKAFKNYGWVNVEEKEFKDIQIKWDSIADDCEFWGGKWYFFSQICQERQAIQPVPGFFDSGTLEEFLYDLADCYAYYDPKFEDYENFKWEQLHGDCDEDDEGYDEDEINQRATELALDDWHANFYDSLNAVETTSQIEVDVERLAFLPKHVSVVLEKYRQGDVYVFPIDRDPVPNNMPKYDSQYLRTFLSKQLDICQNKLERVIKHLVRSRVKDNSARQVRYKLARLCLKWHCGLITPEYIAEFRLSNPKKDNFLARWHFIHGEQENYYIAEALWVWALEHLLEIFDEFGELEEVKLSLLASLSPVESQIFERAFYEHEESLCVVSLESILCHMDFPIAVFKDQENLIFTKNHDFKSSALLCRGARDLGNLRTLFGFGSLEETKIKEIMENSHCNIQSYATQLQAEESTDPQNKYSPKAIKKYLDKHIIGQDGAKKRMSLVFSDHYKRINGQSNLIKANAICVGPSGSGKTFLIEKATEYLDIPYCIANAASFTPTGYRGEETDQMFIGLYVNADKNIEKAQKGVIVLDEVDKLGQGNDDSKEWRQGVQNELLKAIEKGVISFEYDKKTISLKTDQILFVALGHFEKLWHGNSTEQKAHSIGFIPTDYSKPFKLPQFSNEDLMECGMKREFLRRFAVRVVFDLVDIDMLAELFNRRIQPFCEEFKEKWSALEFSSDAKRLLIEDALKEGTGMSALDQKIHEVLTDLRFDIENYKGLKCIITKDTLKIGQAVCVPL